MKISPERLAKSWLAKQNKLYLKLNSRVLKIEEVPEEFVVLYFPELIFSTIFNIVVEVYSKETRLYYVGIYACDAETLCIENGYKFEEMKDYNLKIT